MPSSPHVSVVMPVYNAEPFVASAVESVRAQSFEDFELITVDDGSTDGSLGILGSIRDGRLRVVARPHAGVVQTMNAALELCRATLVARADADDLCAPERLARQVEYLAAHPSVAILGGALRCGHEVLVYPAGPQQIRWRALYQSPFANTTLMFRRHAAQAVGGYPAEYRLVDDYPFVSKIIARYEGANVPDILVAQRVNPGGITGRHGQEQVAEGDRVRRHNLRALLASGTEVEDLFTLLTGGRLRPGFRKGEVGPLLDRLLGAFRRRWVSDEAGWRRLAPWIGTELFQRALQHQAAPGILVRMVGRALRLDPTLVACPRAIKGLVKHLILPRLGA